MRTRHCRLLDGEPGKEKRFGTDKPFALPPGVAFNNAMGLPDGIAAEAGLLKQLASSGIEWCLARFDSAAWWLPQQFASNGISPLEQQNPTGRVEAHDPNRWPGERIHVVGVAYRSLGGLVQMSE